MGQALVKLLQQKSGELRDRYGIEWKITGIASRSLGWIQILFPLIALMNTDRKPEQEEDDAKTAPVPAVPSIRVHPCPSVAK